MMDEIKITGYQCKKCGKVHYPFHERCLQCKGTEFTEVKPQGDPKLLAFTQIFNLPWGFNVRCLTIGIVEFGNKMRAMGQIQDVDFAQLKTGMKLKAYWLPVRQQYGEDVYGLVLKPE